MVKECDKEFIENLDYSEIEFSVAVKQYNKIDRETKQYQYKRIWL